MSTPANDDHEPDAAPDAPTPRAPAAAHTVNPGSATSADDADDLDALAGQTRRGISEWAVVLALVALIVAVAWSQFGSRFSASTEGTGGVAAPGVGVEIEGEGIELGGGSAMSTLGPEGPRVVGAESGRTPDTEDDEAAPAATGPRGASDE